MKPTHVPPRKATPAAQLTAARRAARSLAAAKASSAAPDVTDPVSAAETVASALESAPKTPAEFRTALLRAAKAAGLSDRFASTLADRLNRTPQFAASGVELATAQLIGALQDRLRLAISFMDEHVMAQASARDLVIITGVLIDKIRLLQDQPTQIVDDRTRKSLDELWPALVAEAARRGLAIPSSQLVDVTPQSGRVTPTSPDQRRLN